jgi:hypothetical protein
VGWSTELWGEEDEVAAPIANVGVGEVDSGLIVSVNSCADSSLVTTGLSRSKLVTDRWTICGLPPKAKLVLDPLGLSRREVRLPFLDDPIPKALCLGSRPGE